MSGQLVQRKEGYYVNSGNPPSFRVSERRHGMIETMRTAGYSLREIALELGISSRTVSRHIAYIDGKRETFG